MRILLAFIITTVIYLLLLFLYFTQFNKIEVKKKRSQVHHIIKIDVLDFPIIKEKASSKMINKFKKNTDKNKKKFIKVKKTIKNNQVKSSKLNKNIKKYKKHIPKENKIIKESEIIFIENPLIFDPLRARKDERERDYSKIYPNQKIKKLYGESFHSFTQEQQKFIVNNLDEIHRITQQTLSLRGYPSGALAMKTAQEGTNIVSFNLHPNGDITDLHLLKKVGYRILDENTLETIRTAYKDYPYPREVTKIIFYVEYSIFPQY